MRVSAKRFLSILCLAGLVAVALAPSAPVFGQGSSYPPPPYHIHLHDYYGYNYPL